MREARVARDIEERPASAVAVIGRGVVNGFYARQDHCSGAHRTRLKGGVKDASVEPAVLDGLSRSGYRQQFGVSGWIGERLGAVMIPSQHPALFHHDGTDRYLTFVESIPRFRQGKAKEMGGEEVKGGRAFPPGKYAQLQYHYFAKHPRKSTILYQ